MIIRKKKNNWQFYLYFRTEMPDNITKLCIVYAKQHSHRYYKKAFLRLSYEDETEATETLWPCFSIRYSGRYARGRRACMNHGPRDWRQPHGYSMLTWMRTIEQDAQQFNTGLHSTYLLVQDWSHWRKLVGTATLDWWAGCCCWCIHLNAYHKFTTP